MAESSRSALLNSTSLETKEVLNDTLHREHRGKSLNHQQDTSKTHDPAVAVRAIAYQRVSVTHAQLLHDNRNDEPCKTT